MDYKELMKTFKARESSYAPYSHYNVGAALLTKDGKIYRGCNIENAGYTPSNCAERTAFFKAVSEGDMEFEAIAVVGGPAGTPEGEFEYAAPCGVCRQVMAEFCDLEDFKIILAKSEDEYKVLSLNEILPLAFTPKDLE